MNKQVPAPTNGISNNGIDEIVVDETIGTGEITLVYYLHGGAGVPNFGDELIVRQWLDFLGERIADPIVLSGMRKKVLSELFSARYPSTRFTDALSQYQTKLEKSFWGSIEAGLTFFHPQSGGHRNFSKTELDALLAAKVFHLHGGGYINKIWPNHAFYLGFGAALKAETGCRLIGSGLGLTPSPAPTEDVRPLLDRALQSFDAIEVRDAASFKYVNDATNGAANVRLGLDDIFLTPPKTKGGDRTLHISLHSQDWADEAAENIDPSLVNSFENKLFWGCHYRDTARYRSLKDKFPDLGFVDVNALTHGDLPLGRDDFMITSRFHPHMQASRTGIVGQYLSPFQYSKTKHESVLRLGSAFTRMPEMPMVKTSATPDYDPIRIRAKRAFWNDNVGRHLDLKSTSFEVARPTKKNSQSKKIVLHLGLHKTATTTFQNFLESNHQILSENGVSYPNLEETRSEISPLIVSNRPRDRRLLKKCLPANSATQWLLSDENILGHTQSFSSGPVYPQAASRITAFCEQFHDQDIKIFLTLRSPKRFLESLYCEAIRWMPFEEFDAYSKGMNIESFSYREIFEWTLHLPSNATVTFVPFEDEYGGGTVCTGEKILLELGIDARSKLREFFKKNKSRSIMSPEELEVVRNMSALGYPEVAPKFLNMIEEENQRFGSGTAAFIGDEMAMELEEIYKRDLKDLIAT